MHWLRNYGWIALALAGIFACGFATGRRSAQVPVVAAPAIRLDNGRWEASAFEVLDRELVLNESQRVAVRAALSETTGRLRDIRDSALTESKGILIDLIDRISPGLEPEQRKKLDNDRIRLQRNLIQGDGSAEAAYPFPKKPKTPPNP